MFRKFNIKENVSGTTAVKSSVQRQLRTKLVEQYPRLAEEADPAAVAAMEAKEDTRKKGKKNDKGGEKGEGEPEKTTVLDVIWPKKENITLYKCKDHISLYVVDGEALFFQKFDDELFLTLRVIHKFPQVVDRVQVDQGAIRFVLGGATVMAPGLTSPTGKLPETNLPKGHVVAVYAYDKEHAMSIGTLFASTDEIAASKKGQAIDTVHYIGDDLWLAKF